jgi:nitroreductase
MDAITAIHTRRSRPVLTDPAPSSDEMEAILAAAAAAPDHGRHRPWRFVVIKGTGRKAFGEVLAEVYRESAARRKDTDGDTDGEQPDPAAEDRERAKPMRAPVIIAVACAAGGDEKVPHGERLAAVAAATQNLLLAATALGYGAMWRTGAPARSAAVREALGFGPGDEITGFVYLGSIPGDQEPPLAHRDLDGLAREWP